MDFTRTVRLDLDQEEEEEEEEEEAFFVTRYR